MGDSRGPKIAGLSERILIPGTGIELPVDFDLSRRDMLKIAGYGSLAAFIAACGGTTPTTTSGSVTATFRAGTRPSTAEVAAQVRRCG